ncbi:7-carboxy-7-deazaguanine synthase QueE [Nonomuraea aridisoli]|uniref:7-carboxy-7-deazaguanine synthase n=1 Tax=Nonomuraea aridisoli TaxID=2070368 RepID=A0A2W2G8D0_9ACTN|nr:7-carboxy-7-deazaguanine synthase QueE [Nonomuraea aridisoli]PZG23154.1 7-carboxy-7-deazaguanine synthase QueE [Nonomuraea aridisoli]
MTATAVSAPSRAAELLLAERFGPTLQGEGPSIGQSALFIRLSRCNLSCTWCDTPYTWDSARFDLRQQSERTSVADLVAWALAHPVPLIVITGGEPLLQQRHLPALAEPLLQAGRRLEIETNGTVAPDSALLLAGLRFNVSPKLANAGVPADRRIKSAALEALSASGKAVFKFVARDAADLADLAELAERFAMRQVWVMPEGVTADDVLGCAQALAETVIARGWSLSLRLHVLLWGDERGR